MTGTMIQGLTGKLGILLACILLLAMGPGTPSGGTGAVASFDIEGMVGREAPEFTLKDVNGKSVPLSAFRGKVVLLNFWATWCPPCKAEMPSFQKLFQAERNRGLEVVAISTDKSVKDVRDYLSKNRFDFTVLVDDNAKVRNLYRVFSMPTTYLIDRKGVIAEKFMGEYEWTSPEIRTKIEKLL